MADAERDRQQLNARIQRLEMEKLELETENANKVEENNNLLDTLEALNTTISDSDTKIRSLEASLLASQQAVRRLESAANRAADAERHLAVLEEEQDRLYGELRTTKEEARSHSQRFKEAQRGILDMQDQLERMETETRQEQERHHEVVERMERQREVEKQLDVAASRLKGAAVSKTVTDQKASNKIVGHFVRDLLQDNANLQLGMAELREMLLNSNDEIQSLREQLMYHQPLPSHLEGTSPASTLKAELEPQQETPRISQELHIHHHYHVGPKQEPRKSKKKRHSLLPGVFTPPTRSASSTPRPSSPWGMSSPIPNHVTPTMARSSNNWQSYSTPSSEFSSSVPSSPQNQHGFVFDHPPPDAEISTSPTTSFDPMSPSWHPAHNKRASEASSCSFQSLSIIDREANMPPLISPRRRFANSIIHEEDEDSQPDFESVAPAQTQARSAEPSITEKPESAKAESIIHVPRLRRVASHESIMSLSGGLDIHTLTSRPSQMTLRPLGGADAVVTGVTAQPILSRTYAKRSDAALRDHFAGYHTPRLSSSPASQTLSTNSSQTSHNTSGSGIGKWVGWRPWGGASGPVTSNVPTVKLPEKESEPDVRRAPGINQPGPIPGFQKYWAAQRRKGAPAKVTVETIDHAALAEGLQEESATS